MRPAPHQAGKRDIEPAITAGLYDRRWICELFSPLIAPTPGTTSRTETKPRRTVQGSVARKGTTRVDERGDGDEKTSWYARVSTPDQCLSAQRNRLTVEPDKLRGERRECRAAVAGQYSVQSTPGDRRGAR